MSSPQIEAQQVTAGYRDYYYSTNVIPFPSAIKSESKLWWNDGSWWGYLWSPQTATYHIFQFDSGNQSWSDTGTSVDNRRSSLADCLWDNLNQKLYVVSHMYTTNPLPNTSSFQWGRLYRYTYNSSTRQYTLDSGFPVTVTKGQEQALTLAKDSFGVLWVAYTESGKVMINHSLSSDLSWDTPFVLPGDATATSVSSEDIAGILHFGNSSVGVFWSNQNSGKFYFDVHNDGDAATTWYPVETALGAAGQACTSSCAQDHFNVKADSSGNIYAGVLTALNGLKSKSPDWLLVRSTSGTWQSYPITATADNWVRPLVELDEMDGQIYVLGTSPGPGGVIYKKTSPLNSITFASGKGTPFIQSSTDTTINNAASTKQEVNGNTGFLVLASDQNSRYYLHNYVALGNGGPPTINSFTPASGPAGTSVTISGTAFQGATDVEFNGTSSSSFTVVSATQIKATVPTLATSGTISVNTPEGTGTSTASFTVTQASPPVISSFSPASGPIGTAVTIAGSGFTGATSVTFNSVSANFRVASDIQINATVPAGATTGTINVTTPAGASSSTSNFTVTQAPFIGSFSPTSGNIGTSVIVSGSSFTGATVVAFNGTMASFTVNSDSQITTSVPSGATTGKISVTTPQGVASSSSDFSVVPLSITSFSPTSGSGGTQVAILGQGFTGTTSIAFNGALVATFTVVSDSQINAFAPNNVTTGPISVTTRGGTAVSSTNFTVTSLLISSFSPTSGPVGTKVIISGSGFAGTKSVTFNGTTTGFSINSDSQVTVFVPAGATTGPITLTTSSSTASSSSSFTVVSLTISSFSPASGPVGTKVTISGSGLTGTKLVSFNGTTTGFTFVSDSQLTVYVPAGATTGPISVTTRAGTVSSSSTFAVVQLTISSFSPGSGPVGTQVIIAGTGFSGTKSVAFNGVTTSFTFVSDSRLTVYVPSGATTGPISVTTGAGTVTSTDSFTVQ